MYTLLYQLESGTWEDRKLACEALGRSGNPDALKPLMRAAEDPDVEVRTAACAALGQLGHKDAAKSLTTLLPREPEPRVKMAAIEALGKIGDAIAVPALSGLLADRDPATRLQACKAIGRIRDGAALSPLINALKDASLQVRAEACQGLGLLKHPHAIRPLIECLGDFEPSVRTSALEALSRLGENQLVQAYKKALYAERPSLDALHILVHGGDVRVISALITRLSDTLLSNAQRATILDALAGIQASISEIVPSLYCIAHLKRFELRYLEPEGRMRIAYAACRECGATYQVLRARRVIAMIDQAMARDLHYAGDTLRVNWLKRKRLFDFDRVEIGQADDQSVTRFCVDAANDMDAFRAQRYRTVTCVVGPTASLLPNTLAILEKCFGNVEQGR